MAGNNSIQILRGNNVKSTAADEILLDGQPLYDRTTGYLYVGENRTVASTQAVNAHYANTAGTASSATVANYVKGYLYLNGAYSNGTAYNTNWDGRDIEVLYVPTALGNTGQVWGMVNSNRAGWINQTEIPGTIENANHANTADVAYEVSGANVTGTVANANFANTAGRVKNNLTFKLHGMNLSFNGDSNLDLTNYDIIAFTGFEGNGAVPFFDKGNGVTRYANINSNSNGYVLTARSNVPNWEPPVQLYAIEDLGSKMYITYSCSFGSTDSIQFIKTLRAKGYNSASNPFRVVYGVRDNRPISAIYANATNSSVSTRFTIMYLDGGTQFVSYNGNYSNPARLTIHQLSHYQD